MTQPDRGEGNQRAQQKDRPQGGAGQVPHCWDGCSLPAIWARGEEQAQGLPWTLGMFGLSFALQAMAACQDA